MINWGREYRGHLIRAGKWVVLGSTLLALSACNSHFTFEDVDNSLEEQPAKERVYTSNEVIEAIEEFEDRIQDKGTAPLNGKYVANGLRAFAGNDFVTANLNFQRALKYQPQNSFLHMLNGFSYQMRGERGDPDQFKMAEVAYELASRMDPGNSRIPYFMGVLQFKQQKYRKSQDFFAKAIDLDRERHEHYMGLAAASYYLGELDRAHANIDKAIRLAPTNPETLQAGGLVYASLGAFRNANALSNRLRARSPVRSRYLSRRIADWKRYYASSNIQSDGPLQLQLAQNLDIFGVPQGGMFDSTDGNNEDPTSRGALDGSDTGDDITPAPSPASPAQTPVVVPSRTVQPVPERNVGPTVAQAQAVKKRIKIPNMALVDVALIRTEEIYKTSKGVNLLNGLNIFFTGDQFLELKTPFGLGRFRTTRVNDTMKLKLGTAGAGLTYSLNIFSNNYDRNEVIARPTILVEDTKKSSFFSGATMHIVIEGGVAGSGAMQPLDTGVRLEVTPKFLDPETISLNVFAQRIFLEAGLSQVSDTITGTSFAKTSKTAVTANATLRYGETLVLSGLSDQEKEILDDKVPGLGDTPGVQYFFRNQVKTSSKKTILVLLTPRRPGPTLENGTPIPDNSKIPSSAVDKLEQSVRWLRPAPHLSAFVEHLSKYEFFNHYRKGDMQLENWAGEGTVFDSIMRTLDYLYINYNFEKNDKAEL